MNIGNNYSHLILDIDELKLLLRPSGFVYVVGFYYKYLAFYEISINNLVHYNILSI
jgi:hypothetical protein